MKSNLVISSLAGLFIAGSAAAQSGAAAPSVVVYGILDVSVEHLSHVGAASASLTRMPGLTGTVPSRLGFRGSEPLGGELSAVFALEMGLLPDSGQLGNGGRAFGRQAFVGLSSPMGTVSLGRQYSMLYWSVLDADLMAPNLYGTASLDPQLGNLRADNMLVYKGSFSGLTVGAGYSFGRDGINAGPSPAGQNCAGESATDGKACRSLSAMLKYDTPQWGAALALDRANGRTVGAPPDAVYGNLNSSAKTDRRIAVNGYVKLGTVKATAGLMRRDNDGDAVKPQSDLWYLQAAITLAPQWVIDGGYFKLHYRDMTNADAALWALRSTWTVSKRTALYGQLARIGNESGSAVSVSAGGPGAAPRAGEGQMGVNLGIRHVF